MYLTAVANAQRSRPLPLRAGETAAAVQQATPETLDAAWQHYKKYFLRHQFRALQTLPAYPKKIATKLHEIEAAQGQDLVTTRQNKAPGAYSYALWDRDGWAGNPLSPHPRHENTDSEGFAYLDNQHLRSFYLHPSNPNLGRVTLVGAPKNQTPGRATYLYHLSYNPKVAILRQETVGRNTLRETFDISNTADTPVALDLTLGGAPQDVLEARGIKPLRLPHRHTTLTQLSPHHLRIQQTSHDPARPEHPTNTLRTHILVQPSLKLPKHWQWRLNPQTHTATLHLAIPAHQQIRVPLVIQADNTLQDRHAPPMQDIIDPSHTWYQFMGKVIVQPSSTAPGVSSLWHASQKDLRQLSTVLYQHQTPHLFMATSIPRYVCPYGRDALITADQQLPLNTELAKGTLRIHASLQGKESNAFNAEEPGKILLEHRLGELARNGLVPHAPHYGSVDATPLWISLFAKTVQATGDTAFMQELWPAFQQAIGWLDSHIDARPHSPTRGLLVPTATPDNRPTTLVRLRNPNWMDTDAAQLLLPHQNGQPTPWRQVDRTQRFDLKEPPYPLAYVEVQAYAYQAYKAAEALYRRQGDEAQAAHAAHKAAALQERFNKVFWNPAESYLHRAVGADGTPVDAPGSSALQVLHSGILPKGRAEALAKRLTRPQNHAQPGTGDVRNDLLSGLGVRTLSSDHPGFSPVSFHNGTVWPHDTQLGQRGFETLARRHPDSLPIKTAARELTHQLLNMGQATKDGHLVELVGGFDFSPQENRFIPYPGVCKPQAWSAGVPNALLLSNLGLEVDGFAQKLTLNRPWLPAEIDKVTLRRVKVGPHSVTLHVAKPDAERGKDTDKLLVSLQQPSFSPPIQLVHLTNESPESDSKPHTEGPR